jgi:integrase
MPKMTKRAVDALDRPRKSQEFLWDSELRGFGVRVVPSGLKTFIVQYRTAAGRSRRLAIGRYGLITVEQARDQAKIKLGMVASGVDPAEQEDVPEDSMTVSDLCDWYLKEAKAGLILGRRNRAIKASSLAMDESRIKTHIKPLLGNRLVSSLRILDVEGMQSDIVLGKTAKARGTGRGGVATGGPGVAGRAVTTLQSIFAHAVRHDKIERHPSLGVRRLAAKRKVRRLSLDEIVRMGKAMRFADRNGESPTGLAVVRFLALTGFRISEAQRMHRNWLHADLGYVAFPDTKGDAQVRAIGASAARLAASQPIQLGSPFVFPATMGDGSYTAAKACLRRLCAMVAIENVTPHTLRHTFASIAGELGFSELVIAAMLGHSAQSVTQGYVHVDDALKVAVARTCDEIAGLLDG